MDRLVGEFILSRAIGLVTRLNIMDSQKEDLGLPGMWVSLYFGFIVLCSLMTGSCIVFLHWKKYLQWDRRVQQWVEVIRATTFVYSPHLYWINKKRYYGINAAITIGPPPVVAKTEIKVKIPDSPWGSHTPEGRGYVLRGSSLKVEVPGPQQAALVVLQQPLANRMSQRQTRSPFPIPTFQEIPIVLTLHNIPMLDHIRSYPLDIYPERNVHFHSLPTLTME